MLDVDIDWLIYTLVDEICIDMNRYFTLNHIEIPTDTDLYYVE